MAKVGENARSINRFIYSHVFDSEVEEQLHGWQFRKSVILGKERVCRTRCTEHAFSKQSHPKRPAVDWAENTN